MNNGLVSVIVPIYNVVEYLDQCITSIVSQTYRNIEIILVDDGSKDNSGIKCDEWEKKDPRIKVYHKENGGPSAARNYGLDVAKGEYVYFCDSDDKPRASLLKKALAVFDSDERIDMVAFGYKVISTRDDYSDMNMADCKYDMSTDEQRLKIITGPFSKHQMGWNLWNRVLKKSVIDTYNLRLDNHFKVGEDKLFCLMYLSHCQAAVTIQDCLYDYIQRPGSIMDNSRIEGGIDASRYTNIAMSLYAHYQKNKDCSFLLKHFPLIFYPLIEYEIKSYESTYPEYNRLKNLIDKDLLQNSNINFFYEMLSGFDPNSQYLRGNYNRLQLLEKRAYVKWLLKGKCLWVSLISRLKKRMI